MPTALPKHSLSRLTLWHIIGAVAGFVVLTWRSGLRSIAAPSPHNSGAQNYDRHRAR